MGKERELALGGAGEPWFGLEKCKENIVYIAQGEDNEYLYSDEALITNINWISDKKPDKCTAKFRYRQKTMM